MVFLVARIAIEGGLRRIARSYDIGEAAALLDLDRGEISRRISAGALYAYSDATSVRIPSWQFTEGHELPHLSTVIAAGPPQVHPDSVGGLRISPQDTLEGLTPLTHRARGGDPGPVEDLLGELTRW